MSKFEELTALFYGEAKDAAAIKIADFIVWAIQSGNHEDIADEFLGKKKKLADVITEIRKRAQKLAVGNCAMVTAPEVYTWAVEIIGLRDCLTRAEIDRYCLGEAPTPEAAPAPEPPKPAGLDLGLDDLFG